MSKIRRTKRNVGFKLESPNTRLRFSAYAVKPVHLRSCLLLCVEGPRLVEDLESGAKLARSQMCSCGKIKSALVLWPQPEVMAAGC